MEEVEVNSCDENGCTPLMTHVYQGHDEVVAGLIQIGAEVNAQAKNGITALMIAALSGRKDLVLMLLTAGADTRLTTESGLRAVDFAQQGGHSEIAHIIEIWSQRPWSTPPEPARRSDSPQVNKDPGSSVDGSRGRKWWRFWR